MPVAITLDDGPAMKASLGNTYRGRDLPPQVAMMTNNIIQCPRTGKNCVQEDNDKVFLVPV